MLRPKPATTADGIELVGATKLEVDGHDIGLMVAYVAVVQFPPGRS